MNDLTRSNTEFKSHGVTQRIYNSVLLRDTPCSKKISYNSQDRNMILQAASRRKR